MTRKPFLFTNHDAVLEDGNNTGGLCGADVEDEKALLSSLDARLNTLRAASDPDWHPQTDEETHYSYTRIVDDALDTVEVVRVTHSKHKGDSAEYLHTIICLSEYGFDCIRQILDSFGADPLLSPDARYEGVSDFCDKLCATYKARREEIANLIGETMTGREMPPAMADALAKKLTNT